jgi:hypothetical protein
VQRLVPDRIREHAQSRQCGTPHTLVVVSSLYLSVEHCKWHNRRGGGGSEEGKRKETPKLRQLLAFLASGFQASDWSSVFSLFPVRGYSLHWSRRQAGGAQNAAHPPPSSRHAHAAACQSLSTCWPSRQST